MRKIVYLLVAIGVSACGASSQNDPIYLALKTNPPTSISTRHLPKLRQGIVSCDVFEEGTARQYMTCWWPAGGSVPPVALLTYHGGGLRRPHPDNIIAPGGDPISGYLLIN